MRTSATCWRLWTYRPGQLELEEGVAALNVDKREKKQGRWKNKGPQACGGGQKSKLVCWKHIKYGVDAFSGEDVEHCAFNQGN